MDLYNIKIFTESFRFNRISFDVKSKIYFLRYYSIYNITRVIKLSYIICFSHYRLKSISVLLILYCAFK